MFFRVLGYLLEDSFQGSLDLPMPFFRRLCCIEHHPWNIERTRIRISGNFPWAKPRRAPCAQLRQRRAVCRTAAKIADSILVGWRIHLPTQNRHQIARMQAITNLMTLAVESDVL